MVSFDAPRCPKFCLWPCLVAAVICTLSLATPITSFTIHKTMIRNSLRTASRFSPRTFVSPQRTTVTTLQMIPSSYHYVVGSWSRPHKQYFASLALSPTHLQATVVEEDAIQGSGAAPETAISIEDSGTKKQHALHDSISNPLEELTSKPVPGGNWDPENPLGWTKNFGRRSNEYEERIQSLTRLGPGDEGYFDVSHIKHPKATIVRTREQARIVMEVLMNADQSIFHGCDTEVMDIDLKEVGPVGNGYVTCASIYSGPTFDYGLGDGPGTTLWIDNLDDAHGVLQEFKAWFEDSRFLKVWHNYGFDRHVMWNEGIDCQGLGGDTMHMARLQDTSRLKNEGQGYSLEALTSELLAIRKRPMKELFGVARLRRDGTPGAQLDIPPVEILQRDPQFRFNFIEYSCLDAQSTWLLHEKLVQLLERMPWLTDGGNLYEYYWTHMRPFGVVLTDMERRGIRVDAKDYLATVEQQARKDRDEHSRIFREWAARKIGLDGLAMNPASSTQLSTFLFGGSKNEKTGEITERERVFKTAREELTPDALAALEVFEETERTKNEGE